MADKPFDLNDASVITVHLNTKKDFADGKLLFEDYREAMIAAESEMGEVKAMGVLEGGMVSGDPSVSLLIKVKFKNEWGEKDFFYVVAECTGQNFLTASGLVNAQIQTLQRSNTRTVSGAK